MSTYNPSLAEFPSFGQGNSENEFLILFCSQEKPCLFGKKKKDELKSVGDISMKVIISQTFRDRCFQPLTFDPSPFFLLL